MHTAAACGNHRWIGTLGISSTTFVWPKIHRPVLDPYSGCGERCCDHRQGKSGVGETVQTNTGATIPAKNDIMVLAADCTNDVDLTTAEITVNGLRIEVGFSGTITRNGASLSVGSGGYIQSGGTFVRAAPTPRHLVVTGDFTLEGGTFDVPDRLVVTDEFSVDGGTFNRLDQTVILARWTTPATEPTLHLRRATHPVI